MISIYAIKPLFQRAIKPLVSFLFRMGVTPNQVTFLTIVLSVGFGIYFAGAGKESWSFMPIVLLVRMILNAVDGMLAREYQMQSRLGTYLNELGDMVSDVFLYLPFAIEFPWLMGSVIVLSIFSEVAGILSIAVGGERRYDGPMGKSDRAFCLGILGFLMSFGLLNDFWAALFFSLLALLLCFTIFFRIRNALDRA